MEVTMIAERFEIVEIETITHDICEGHAQVVTRLNKDHSTYQIAFRGKKYYLLIDFLEDEHSVWRIIDHQGTITYRAWRNYVYSEQFMYTKTLLIGANQARIQKSMEQLMSVIISK
jgi:hypothetical protein